MLAPLLRPGDVVICDKRGGRKRAGVQDAIEARGASPLYLPPCSPDHKPIELAFSKLWRMLRTTSPRTADALGTAIGRLPTPSIPTSVLAI